MNTCSCQKRRPRNNSARLILSHTRLLSDLAVNIARWQLSLLAQRPPSRLRIFAIRLNRKHSISFALDRPSVLKNGVGTNKPSVERRLPVEISLALDQQCRKQHRSVLLASNASLHATEQHSSFWHLVNQLAMPCVLTLHSAMRYSRTGLGQRLGLLLAVLRYIILVRLALPISRRNSRIILTPTKRNLVSLQPNLIPASSIRQRILRFLFK